MPASSRLWRLRFDGVEALVLALLFSVAVSALRFVLPVLPVRMIGMLGVLGGLGGVTALRLVRDSRALPADAAGGELVGARSLIALLLLGVGWFVICLGVLGVLITVAFLTDVKDASRAAILIPMVPLAVGGALVLAGLRIKRVWARAG